MAEKQYKVLTSLEGSCHPPAHKVQSKWGTTCAHDRLWASQISSSMLFVLLALGQRSAKVVDMLRWTQVNSLEVVKSVFKNTKDIKVRCRQLPKGLVMFEEKDLKNTADQIIRDSL